MAPLMDVHYGSMCANAPSACTRRVWKFVEDQLGIDNLYEAALPLVSYLNCSEGQKRLFRIKDYIVRDGEVLIVDNSPAGC